MTQLSAGGVTGVSGLDGRQQTYMRRVGEGHILRTCVCARAYTMRAHLLRNAHTTAERTRATDRHDTAFSRALALYTTSVTAAARVDRCVR